MSELRLLMLSAMYENGGNTTHRLLDGHPQMLVYPFESQLGTQLVSDHLSSVFPVKYRWPVFRLDSTPEDDFRAVIDEETKVRARTPQVSKFRHADLDLNDEDRARIFARYVRENGRSRANNVAAFLRATFDAWKNFRRTDEQEVYVGYSPIVAVDADKILEDFPQGHVLHVVRNPWSAYADTKKRPVPLSLERYVSTWAMVQYHAVVFQRLQPTRVHVLRYEDIVREPQVVLGRLCEKIGVRTSDTLRVPTWNGAPLPEVYPWGTIREATPKANERTAAELSKQERQSIKEWARPMLETFDYKSFEKAKKT